MAVRDKVSKHEKDITVSAKSKVKKSVEKRGRKKKFLVWRMWVHYALSLFQKDRGKIPDNIGDRILITNNVYATRYYLSSVIHVTTVSMSVPFTFVGEISRYLREHKCTAVVDVTFKNTSFEVNLKDSGLRSRKTIWEKTIARARAEREGDFQSIIAPVTEREEEIAARCLYTIDVAKTNPLYKTWIFITLRAKTGSELTHAEKLCYEFLDSIDCEYNQVSANLQQVLKYMTIISDYRNDSVKDLKAIITSEKTLAEMSPNSGSFNGSAGTYLGVNILNGSHFNFDWKAVTIARNVYIVAPSGVGKTVLALNLACSAVEEGYAVCVQDIKGNEFNNFTNATGGYIVSLRQNSTGYINSWVMHKSDTLDENAEAYFRQRIAFSKEQIIILSGLTSIEDRTEMEELIDAFHDAYYTSIGVSPTNRNSWYVTERLDPFVIYDALTDYLTPEVISRYPSMSRKILNELRLTMSRDGSKSYIFKQEFDYASILKAPTLQFDFGILESATTLDDPILFKLKFAYMRKLNAEYIAYKYSQNIKVVKILEESQIVANEPDIMRGYVEEFTLRRAQGQTTLLLGNSVSALTNNVICQSLIDNVRAVFVGLLDKDARETLIDKLDLDEYRPLLEKMNIESFFANSFLFINKMEPRPALPIIKVILEEGWEQRYKLFTPVAQSNSFIS